MFWSPYKILAAQNECVLKDRKIRTESDKVCLKIKLQAEEDDLVRVVKGLLEKEDMQAKAKLDFDQSSVFAES